MTYSTATKIEKLQNRREKLEQQLDNIKQQQRTCEAKQKANTRKELNRQKYQLGELVLLAYENRGKKISDTTLLGALLQVIVNATPERVIKWDKIGSSLLISQRQKNKQNTSAQDKSKHEEVRTSPKTD